MKRITKIEIKNYRAFYDEYTVELNQGENLLIYGENGSGKSSLFKSLSDFLSSSQNTAYTYIRHQNKDTEDGSVSLTFNNYTPESNTISPADEVFNFGTNAVNTNTEQFLKTAELTKGFLDYRVLLAVYNHSEAKPNLFKLIVETLLKEFIPVNGSHPMGNRFISLRNYINTARNRRTWQYRGAIEDMEGYETSLRGVLKGVFLQLNMFLIKYFKLNLRVWYSLSPLVATPNNWRSITTELRLNIKLNGKLVEHQSDYLNEARLSALAICLYLAILKRNPQTIDFKLLFLDDVFIGLDLTNRLPILDIIKNEFSDYQVFISTYDRHLYELAKRKFETETPNRWKSVELYVGKDLINNQIVNRPILVIGQSHFEKGCQYLHDRVKPDYPASANYFRKALEEIIQQYIPKWETADAENTQIPDYKLGTLIYRAKRFLDKSGNSSSSLNQIITLLSSILHPLSHHEISSPVYRGELVIIENLIPKLIAELKALDIQANFKCSVLEGQNKIKIKYVINAVTGHFSIYLLRITEPLVLKFNDAGVPSILDVNCHAEKCWGVNNGAKIKGKTFSKEEKELLQYNFSSMQDAYDRLHAFIIKIPEIGIFAKSANYLNDIEYLDQQGNWKSLSNIIVW